MVMFTGLFGVITAPGVGAVPEADTPTTVTTPAQPATGENTGDGGNTGEAGNTGTADANTGANTASTGASCESSLGALGWLVCPTTGKISEAVDWLYDKIEDILVINPVEAADGKPIYEIWKYFKGVTNIVFIIFLLVVIYSQLTGYGISNYGLKKALPKLIVTAVLVNLSFIICSLLVDLSNVVGNGLRGLFESIEAATMSGMSLPSGQSHIAMSEMYSSLAGGTALAIGGGIIAFETGAIWMLIPVALGAIVSVAAGLITIALRQAVVVLLVMISPLAMVAYMLPNTEKWFKQWKQLLSKMLIFYPMFSLLFGASSLAGWAIIVNAQDGFSLLLGTAVQIFPLFFSWKMMQMSGTFLAGINASMHRMAARPLATNRGWADSHRMLTKQKNLASGKAYTPSLRLQQFVMNRKIAREEETSQHATTVKNRGLAYSAKRNYKRGDLDGMLNRRGMRAYEDQAKGMEYQQAVLRHSNNMNKGYGYRAQIGTNAKARLDQLDARNVVASDMLKAEQARAEKIEYENAVGFHQRMEAAVNAHFDTINAGDSSYKQHFVDAAERKVALGRYGDLNKIMEGNVQDVQYVAATAAQAYDTQSKIIAAKFQKYFELTPPTKDVVHRLREFSYDPNKRAVENIDSIITGMRVLNQRGDTDLVKDILDDVLNEGVNLGSHASQSLASFLMFEVKDNDPFLRRFGKYINLETAHVYNSNKRQEERVTYDEYVTGVYGTDENGEPLKSKRPMNILMEGTSLDNIERTALSNLDSSLKKVYTKKGENGEPDSLDVDGYLAKREEIQTAVGPQFISASLKYLSGSEQLKSAVKFLTGYSEQDGKLKAVWDDKIWDGKDVMYSDEDKAKLEAYYRKKTESYFKDQTPAQILGMRSDYKNPVIAHMVEAWLDEEDPENPDRNRRAEYNAEVAAIQNRYGDLPADEAEKKRKADIAQLRSDITGRKVRDILANSGKLEQIYDSKRSGAANNSKDWMRAWLQLDNKMAMQANLQKIYDKQKKEYADKQNTDTSDNDGVEISGVYGDEDRFRFLNELDQVYSDLRGSEPAEFFEETMDQLDEWFGDRSKISRMYSKYYEQNPHADMRNLKDYLVDLLSDLDNYPGA
ncbi:MAG: MFS transporter [Candidatus Saccharibacteria bacterium]|nr:MFS transporter [Candidatus Saccharibacteria bacterium]